MIRVVYDISMLGLARLSPGSRGGSYRADRHVVPRLAASASCELQACANHSALAWKGARAYLRAEPDLGQVRLLGEAPPTRAALSEVIGFAHRIARKAAGPCPLPRLVRRGGKFVDRQVHPQVSDGSPPAAIFHTSAASLPVRPRESRSPQRFLTIYDLSYAHFPHLYGSAYRDVMDATLASLRPDDWVITSSEATREDLVERGVAPLERIFVVPLAADPTTFYPCHDLQALTRVRQRYRIPEGPYLLSVNSPDPRKNLAHAIRAFGRVVRQERLPELSLVLAGNDGPGTPAVHAAIEAVPELRSRIVLTGFVPDEALAPLYSGALALVYPSLYEGFGLPPLEAMQCGTPAVTARTSSLPEVVGEGGIMLDADDIDGLCATILRLYRDSGFREALSRSARARAARFSWESTTQRVVAAYRAALNASS